MDVQIVTVHATSPLTVVEHGATVPVKARVVSGSSYTPTVGNEVLAVLVGGYYRVWGKA